MTWFEIIFESNYKIKLILTILFMTTITSCDFTESEIYYSNKFESVAIDNSKQPVEDKLIISKVTFEGHSYLWTERGDKGGLTHDMNCNCFKYLWKNNTNSNSYLLKHDMKGNDMQKSSPDGY